MEKSIIDIMWIVNAAILVFFMQAGFAALESGLTRSKNSINVAIKNITDFLIAVILFWAFGYGLMFGTSLGGYIGASAFPFESFGAAYPSAFFLFQVMFCATTATIVSGAVAERVRYDGYIYITIIISGLIYPIFGHWVWGKGGWLAEMGFVDFAGSSVVHSVGGWVSLASVLVVGPRWGRFPEGGGSVKIPGHNLILAILGTLILFFGWFGFNGGSTLAMNSAVPGIILNTTVGGSAGGVSALATGWMRTKIADVGFIINGSLAGLVAVTANCHAVTPGEAMIIGAVAGQLVQIGEYLLDRWRIDDVVGAFPVHAVNGIWGTLAVALFGDPKILGTGLDFYEQLAVQGVGILVCAAWSFGTGSIIFSIINRITPLRVSPEDEHMGLNVAEHGATTEILDLFRVMDEHARTGNLNLRAPVEPFTEVGQIANRYNQVVGRLEISEQERDLILKNVHDGLFLLDPEFRIGTQYSTALTDILENEELAGVSILDLLTPIVEEKTSANARDFLELMFSRDVDERMVLNLNPLKQLKITFHGKTRHIRFRFSRVMRGGSVIQLLVTVMDVTRRVELEDDLKKSEEKTRTEMERIFQILSLDPVDLNDFLRGMSLEIATMNCELRSDDGPLDYGVILGRIYRSLHAVKGEAALLGLKIISERVHDYEDTVSDIMMRESLSGEDFVPIIFMVTGLKGELAEMHETVNRLKNFQKTVQSPESVMSETLMKSLERMVSDLARRQGKEVEFVSNGFTKTFLPDGSLRTFKDVLIQLVRNSITHGIESPEERERIGKARKGKIELSFAKTPEGISVIFRDDGRGLQIERIRERALHAGLIREDEAGDKTPSQLARLIFHPQFSTADEVSEDAGRGVGMEIVRSRLISIGGKMKMAFQSGRYMEFVMQFNRG